MQVCDPAALKYCTAMLPIKMHDRTSKRQKQRHAVCDPSVMLLCAAAVHRPEARSKEVAELAVEGSPGSRCRGHRLFQLSPFHGTKADIRDSDAGSRQADTGDNCSAEQVDAQLAEQL